jgi:Galactose oxidase, central domain
MRVIRRIPWLTALSLLVAAPCLAQSIGGFRPTGDMTAPRSFHTATRLHDGKVLMAGCTRTTSAELYDPASQTFTPTGSMTAVRCGHSATLLADGRVLIAGGVRSDPCLYRSPPDSYCRSAELYDPIDGTFKPTGDMIGIQIGHTATLLLNGRVLIAGGLASECWGCPAQVSNPELYDPSTGTFSLTGAFAGKGNVYVTGGPAVSAAVALSDGRVLIAAEPTSELYDPLTGTFTLTGSMTTLCFGWPLGYIAGRTATLLTNGLVLLTGGEHEDCGRFANAELYDVVTGRFTATGSMTRPRDNHSATLLPDGTVLIAGGESQDCNKQWCIFSGTQASAEVFDPSTGRFTPTAEMSARRAGHSATALNDGTVLVAGGYLYEGIGRGSCCFASAELYVGATVPGGQLASPDGTTVPTATQIVATTVGRSGRSARIKPSSVMVSRQPAGGQTELADAVRVTVSFSTVRSSVSATDTQSPQSAVPTRVVVLPPSIHRRSNAMKYGHSRQNIRL